MERLGRRSLIGDEFLSFTRKDLLIKLILLFPITTLLQHHIGILNKLLFFLVLIVMLFAGAVRKKPLLYLGIVSLLWAYDMCITPLEAFKLNFNMSFYYIFLVFYLVFILDDQKKVWQILLKNRRYIFYIVLIYTGIVALSIFLPSSYSQSAAGGWGDSKYFTSISGSPNRVGPASVFIVVLITFLIATGSPKGLALLAVPNLYVFLMGGSRTYFVVGLCVTLVMYYVMIPAKRWFYWSLLPLGAVMVAVVLQSSMMDKFAATFATGVNSAVFWQKLTNTRSIFWVKQLELFSQTPLLNQLFGNGINFTTYQYGLWAHSDFIEILCSYGYVGLLNYLTLMVYTMHTLMKTKKSHFFIKCVCVFVWLFNAFFNFFYCYFCAMLCYPILLLIIQHADEAPVRRHPGTLKNTN